MDSTRSSAVPPRLLHTVRETQALLGDVSVSTVYNLFARQRLTRLKLGARTMVARSDIERLIDSLS